MTKYSFLNNKTMYITVTEGNDMSEFEEQVSGMGISKHPISLNIPQTMCEDIKIPSNENNKWNFNFNGSEKDKKDFMDKLKIDMISNTQLRIICRFLNITDVNEIKSTTYSESSLLSLLLAQSLKGFMESKGYSCLTELKFSDQGGLVPVDKENWVEKNDIESFVRVGYIYFNRVDSDNPNDNVVFSNMIHRGNHIGSVSCYSDNEDKSKCFINELEEFTKQNNWLRGKKIKNVDMYEGSFELVDIGANYSWDEYYYSKDVIDLLNLEVLGFLRNTEKYNKRGITKRGIILAGSPGTGKTTVGKIICNQTDETVIWITPDSIVTNNSRIGSIKMLYKLADYVSPTITILEDLDLFGGDRSSGGDSLGLGTLMNILDGINSISNSITIATTNRLDSIEEALRNRPGRFDRIVEINELEESLRERMLTDRLQNFKCSSKIIEYMVIKTEKWNGSEIQEFINTLNLEYIDDENVEITESIVDSMMKIMSNFGIKQKIKGIGFS